VAAIAALESVVLRLDAASGLDVGRHETQRIWDTTVVNIKRHLLPTVWDETKDLNDDEKKEVKNAISNNIEKLERVAPRPAAMRLRTRILTS
jgi:hypothetical protein